MEIGQAIEVFCTFFMETIEILKQYIDGIYVFSISAVAVLFVIVLLINSYFKKSAVVSSMARTIGIFGIGGLILHYMYFVIHGISSIIWIDFMHQNPHRSQAHALDLIMWSPIETAILAIIFAFLPVIFATIIAIVSYRNWGRVPFYILFIMVPVCSFGLALNTFVAPDIGLVTRSFALELPIWIGCWWWNNRAIKS